MAYTRQLVTRVAATLAALGIVGMGGCEPPGGGGDYSDGGGEVPKGGGVGSACSGASACRAGLTCTAGACAACQCSSTGTACVASDECAAGFYCGPGNSCEAAGMGAAGAGCTTDADCASGLRCNLVGFNGLCEPEGTTDVGGACGSNADCLAGLACAMGTCQKLAPGVPPYVSTWPGETCADDSGATEAYFHVPRGSNDGDFYRLPFPNDVRLSGGKVSLSGHPTPGSGLLGYDVVARYIADVEATVDGFSTYPTVYFRFSAPVDIGGTLKGDRAVQFFDVTQPSAPVGLSYSWVATTDRNAYICNNWMAIRPAMGQPLTPGHTYAAVLASSVLDAKLQPIQAPADLTALLSASMPGDPALAAEWPKYAPLRAWAGAQNMALSSILNATVFTVGHPAAIGPGLAHAVAASPAATATSWTNCAASPSPCPQATDDRACGMPDPSFDELHAIVTLPILQEGTEPYLTPSDGGDVAFDASGTPIVQRTEPVCMALTVPKGAPMPTGGWPLLVYAHGTGGSFRSHVREGVAARMAAKGIAVLGIDQVETGTRRGASTESPDDLVYNFANPAAARGNFLQGAADQMSLVRFASTLDLPAASSPTHAEIRAGALAFWGHSQGATEGGIAMPFTAGVLGAVMSGQGASLMDALVTKTNPVNVAAALPFALEDRKVDVNHPVVALLQYDLGVVDPLNYAALLVSAPVAAANLKHVFQPYGQNDTYAPPATQKTFALAAQLQEAAPPPGVTPDMIFGAAPLPLPAGGDVMSSMGAPVTALLRQYAPSSSYDGHFVAFDNATAEADVDAFLAAALAGKVPTIGP
jgi:hypothetical protein